MVLEASLVLDDAQVLGLDRVDARRRLNAAEQDQPITVSWQGRAQRGYER